MSQYNRPALPKCSNCNDCVPTFTCDKCGDDCCHMCLRATVIVNEVSKDYCVTCVTNPAAVAEGIENA